METFQHKAAGSEKQAAASAGAGNAVQLKDNRPQSVIQKKQAEALTGSSAGESTIQLMADTIQMVNKNVAQNATIASITEAFPIMGAKCKKAYDKIDHGLTAVSPLEDLMKTFRARLAVLTIFRKAALANGINGATKNINRLFRAGEAGHIDALMQLRTVIMGAGHPDPGNRAAVVAHLAGVTMTKQQIK